MGSKYENIKQLLSELDVPEYRYEQIMWAIFGNRIEQFGHMSNLPQSLRNKLSDAFGESVVCVRPLVETSSNQVGKALLSLSDGNQVEAVRLRYKRGWESFCISSQCGCGFDCAFCATGAAGFRRNLTADEITDQLLYFYLKGHELDSVSFMGMGEPFANPHLFDALRILIDTVLFGLSQRRITVSTIGIIPGIQRMTKEFPQVNLAFSLHSPFQKQRSELMPINKKYPSHHVLKALDEHIRLTGRKVFIAYIMLAGINDSQEHAKGIVRLLKGRGSWEHLYHVDLIAYNPTDKTIKRFEGLKHSQVKRFGTVLKSEGISVTVRAQFGSDIGAACGQLYGSEKQNHTAQDGL